MRRVEKEQLPAGVKRAFSKEVPCFIAVFFGIFILLGTKMGAANMFNTMMNTAHDLLLNTVLTVERGSANSHKDYGWQAFTDAVVEAAAKLPQPVAFVLWGAQAQKKAAVAAASDYPRLLLQSPHPSPLSSYRGFFGSKPFSKINAFLETYAETPIQW